MEALIKNCPFCGSAGKMFAEHKEGIRTAADDQFEDDTGVTPLRPGRTEYTIRCTYCEASVPTSKTLRSAVKRWNKRADET